MSEPLKRKEWKKVRNRRAKVWKRLNGPYEPIPNSVKFILILILLFFGFMAPFVGYWTFNVDVRTVHHCNFGGTYPNCLTAQQAKQDPFSILYNGTLHDSPVGPFGPPRLLSSVVHSGFSGTSPQTQAVTVTSGNLIVVEGTESNSACSTMTVTDSQGNTIGGSGQYGHINSGSGVNSNNLICVQARWAFASATGSDTITNTFGAVNGMAWQVLVYSGVSTLSQSAGSFTGQVKSIAQFPAAATSGFTLLTFSAFAANSIVFEIWSQATDFSCASAGSSTTVSVNKNCQTGATQIFSDYSWSSNLHPNVNQNITWSENGADSLSENSIAALAFEIPSLTPPPCPSGYQCSNAGVDNNNNLDLFSVGNAPSVAVSNSPIDTSTCSSKECLFYESYRNSTALTTGKPWGWFLRTNSTLPTETNYNPLTDGSVAMLFICYPEGAGLNNCYLYEAKTPGQNLLTVSGGVTDPGIAACAQSGPLYGCLSEEDNVGSSSFYTMSTVLNFTGSSDSNVNSGHSGQSATSFITNDGIVQSINIFSGNPGVTPPLLPCADADSSFGCASYTLPFFNMQNSYYEGFFSASGQLSDIVFGTSYGAPLSAAFSHNANSVWYWIPTVTTSVQGTTDTGGFFGFIGREFGGAVNTVLNTIQNVGSYVQNTALGPIGNVLQGMIVWLINQVVNFLNLVGGIFLNNSSLGTQLFTSFNNIVGIVTKILTDFVTWFVNFGTFVQAGVTLGINIFANTIVFGILSFFATSLTTLVSIVLTVITTFFSYATPTSYLLMMDWVWAIMMVYVIGVSGFLWWIDLNVQAFTFVFKMMWKFIESVWATIIIIKSFIPTEGGTQGTVSNPIPQSGGRGGAGSQSGSQGKPAPSKPSEHTQKPGEKAEQKQQPKAPKLPRGIGQGAKDGDPMAVVVMAFLIIVLFFWLSQAAFSPVATVTTAGCYAWSTNCHLQNGIMVGNLDTTVFFSFLFSTQHSIFTLFTIVVPLAVVMFARWFQNNVIGEDEGEEEEGNMFFNW